MKKILIFLIFLNIFFGCSQKKISENNMLDSNQTQENIWGKIDLENWDKTPSVNNRIAIEKDVIDGIAVYYIDGNDVKHKPYNAKLPKLAYYSDSETNKKELVVIIQIEETSKGVIVGYRNLGGGNGAGLYKEFEFLDDKQIKELIGDNSISRLKDDLKKSMLDFIKTGNAEYGEKDANECFFIIDNFLIDIKNSKSKKDGLSIVKNAILQLNNLNKKTNFSLIETMERENIAEIINLAGYEKGYNSKDEDITEQWREW